MAAFFFSLDKLKRLMILYWTMVFVCWKTRTIFQSKQSRRFFESCIII